MIGRIEQAIVDALRGVSETGKLGYTLRTVASYGGELSEASVAVRAFPSVWVAYAGETEVTPVGPGWLHDGMFTVFVATQSRRGDRAARLGVDGEPGSLQILEDVRACLGGSKLGLDISPLTPTRVRSLMQTADASVYALDMATRYLSTPAAAVDVPIGDFLRLHMDWDIPPVGDVQPPLPAENADARNDVFLEGGA